MFVHSVWHDRWALPISATWQQHKLFHLMDSRKYSHCSCCSARLHLQPQISVHIRCMFVENTEPTTSFSSCLWVSFYVLVELLHCEQHSSRNGISNFRDQCNMEKVCSFTKHTHKHMQTDWQLHYYIKCIAKPFFFGVDPMHPMKSACHLFNLSNLRHIPINFKLCIEWMENSKNACYNNTCMYCGFTEGTQVYLIILIRLRRNLHWSSGHIEE